MRSSGDFPVKPESVYFVSCPKQGLEMEPVVLHRVGLLGYFCPKQGQDFKPSAAPLYTNMGQVPPPPPAMESCQRTQFNDPAEKAPTSQSRAQCTS